MRELLERAREGARLLPDALGRPPLLQRWLAGAREAQIAVLVALPLLWFGLPAILGPTLDALYPPLVQREKVLGLFVHHVRQEDPRRERRESQATVLAWLAAGGVVSVLLLARLPQEMAAEGAGRGRDGATVVLQHDRPLDLVHTAPAAVPPLVGGRYRLKEVLGQGGMGVVHRAVDETLGREVALKELPHGVEDRDDLVHRFRQEARVLARLAHPNVVAVYDLVEDAGRMWIAMELVSGGDLANLLDARERLSPAEALPLALGIAEGIRHAHAQGVVHRDIKAMNVLLTREGVPKVTDFGLARLSESSVHTQHGTILGSPRYMSPEQASGRPADARSDVYSFGILLYEMLAGCAPFEGEMRSVIAQHITQPPRPLRELVPELPDALGRLVLSMLEKDPDDRPPDFTSVVDALRTLGAEAAR